MDINQILITMWKQNFMQEYFLRILREPQQIYKVQR